MPAAIVGATTDVVVGKDEVDNGGTTVSTLTARIPTEDGFVASRPSAVANSGAGRPQPARTTATAKALRVATEGDLVELGPPSRAVIAGRPLDPDRATDAAEMDTVEPDG